MGFLSAQKMLSLILGLMYRPTRKIEDVIPAPCADEAGRASVTIVEDQVSRSKHGGGEGFHP